jgi:hypothetical protein
MLRTFVITMLHAGVSLRDVQIAAQHADPRTTMRYDRPGGLSLTLHARRQVLLDKGSPDRAEMRRLRRDAQRDHPPVATARSAYSDSTTVELMSAYSNPAP